MKKEEYTISAQLGYFVGEYIYHTTLPTLSTDALRTRKVIKVSEEDTKEHDRLEKELYESWKDALKAEENPKWIAYRDFNRALAVKYLPHKLTCFIPTITLDHIDDVKRGIIDSLWNTDLCAYSLKPENINIYQDQHGWHTMIDFILGATVNDF